MLKNLNDSYKGKNRPIIVQGKYNRLYSLGAFVDGKINMSAWNKLFHRKVWENIRFPVGHIYEDTVTIFRVFNISESVFVLNQTLYYYRKCPGSITETCLIDSIPDLELAFSHLESFISENIPNVFQKNSLERDNNHVLTE